ncbi:MAG: CsbD family protein [Bryobacteraceae bacterium]
MLFGPSNLWRLEMKDSLKDQAKGKADELAGKAKEKVGQATDNASP